MQYFTVKNYGPGDLAGSVSAQTGTDDEGTAWACVKFLDGATLPTWTGQPFELTPDEAIVASQSALYTGGQSGPLYRGAALEFGTATVEDFVSVQSGLSVYVQDAAFKLLFSAAFSGIEGFVPLLRYQVARVPVTPSAAFTAPVKALFLQKIDDWLCKFPGQTSPQTSTQPVPQLSTISEAEAGGVLALGGSYLVASASGAFSMTLPPWSEQSNQTPRPVSIVNTSGAAMTVSIDVADPSGPTFVGGASSLVVAAGAKVSLATADDGGALWVEV